MSDAVRRPRLNPFAFPSDTTLRFVLLVIFVICGSGRLYGDFGQDAETDRAASECISKAWSQVNNVMTTLNTVEHVENMAVIGAVGFSSLADCAKMLRPRVLWKISGICATIILAAIIYWLYPIWKLRVGRLEQLSTSEVPEVEQELRDICRAAHLTSPPIFVWNPIATGMPLAFGRGGRYYVALSGSFITRFFYSDKSAFRAIILHELAHIRNGDVSKTYLVISLLLAFITITIFPSLLVSSWILAHSRLPDAMSIIVYAVFWTAVVVLSGLAVLRAREYYADLRASVWDEVSHIDHALGTLPTKVDDGWRRLFRLHPRPVDRRRIVEDPSGLFPLSYFDAFGIGIAAWSVIDVLKGVMAPFFPGSKWAALSISGQSR